MIKKSGTKIWMNIYNKPTDPKRHVLFTWNHRRDCLTNIPFSLARIIYTIVKNENVREKNFKELKKTLLEQKCSKSLIEASISKAKEIDFQILREPKNTKNEQIYPFTTTCNPKNLNLSPILKQSFNNLRYSKTMLSISQEKKGKSNYYFLRDDTLIIIEEAGKSSGILVWNWEKNNPT